MMLVLSNLPPKPVSITAMSTDCCANQSNAMATVISKKEGSISSINGIILLVKSTTNDLEHISPLTFILSLKSCKCGDVYKPVLYPASCKIAANMWLVEPLPLVPAICMVLNLCCGLPNASQSLIVLVKSFL